MHQKTSEVERDARPRSQEIFEERRALGPEESVRSDLAREDRRKKRLRHRFIKPITDRLDEFFVAVDYRVLSTALCGFAVLLVLVGAFTPHDEGADADEEDNKDKKKAADAPDDDEDDDDGPKNKAT